MSRFQYFVRNFLLTEKQTLQTCFAFRLCGFKLLQPDLSFVGLVGPVGSQVQCAELVRTKCYTSVLSVLGSSDQLVLMQVCFWTCAFEPFLYYLKESMTGDSLLLCCLIEPQVFFNVYSHKHSWHKVSSEIDSWKSALCHKKTKHVDDLWLLYWPQYTDSQKQV